MGTDDPHPISVGRSDEVVDPGRIGVGPVLGERPEDSDARALHSTLEDLGALARVDVSQLSSDERDDFVTHVAENFWTNPGLRNLFDMALETASELDPGPITTDEEEEEE